MIFTVRVISCPVYLLGNTRKTLVLMMIQTLIWNILESLDTVQRILQNLLLEASNAYTTSELQHNYTR